MPELVSHHSFKPLSGGAIGFTVESNFCSVSPFSPAYICTFFHDEDVVVFDDSSTRVKIKLKYKNLAFLNYNCQEDGVIIGYNHPPFVEHANPLKRNAHCTSMDFNLSRIVANLKESLHNGSAIYLKLKAGALTCDFVYMLKLHNIDVFGCDFYVENYKPANFVTKNYSEACVISQGYPGSFLLDFYKRNDNELTEKMLRNIFYHVSGDRHLRSVTVEESPVLESDDENYVKIKNIKVTPTGTIYYPPELKISNHMLRKVDTDRVISVTFCDNDGQQIKDRLFIRNKVRDLLHGGLTICRLKFNYNMAPSSKFRDHSHYFYAGTKQEVLCIYNGFGEFKAALPAKIGARVGLNSSSARIGIPLDRFKVVPDIKSADGKYNFTDGCGLITRAFAVKLQRKFGLKYLPSAFQIRFPGFKGVLLLTNQVLRGDQGDVDVVFTEEMQKFYGNCHEATLDIIRYSSPVALNLNKNLIEVLCQIAAKFGQQHKSRVENRIKEMARNAVIELVDKCVNPAKFLDTLESLPKYMDYRQMKSFTQSELLSEPFLRSLVQADAAVSMKRLHEKQQIPIHSSMGRNMIGVPDFHGFLEPNQVYVRYSETLDPKCKEKIVHKGPVAVTRSPLYHLGGIQFVEAVDVPYYTALDICDVIIFPTKGFRPLQESMAGGDLDGDEYSVFWDKDLLLPFSIPLDSVNVEAVSDKSKFITVDKLHAEYPQFILEYMTKLPVGAYSNSHQHMAELYGYGDDRVLQLAAKNEDALVYFKSGIAAKELTNEEKTIFSPEHMRKDHLPGYRLDNVLSRNHLFFHEFHEDIEDISSTDTTESYIDPKVDVKGWEQFQGLATSKYNNFLNQIKVIMTQFGILKMSELFSGKMTELKNGQKAKDGNDELTSVSGLIQSLVNQIMRTNREELLDECVPGWRQDMLDKDKDVSSYYSKEMPEKLQQYAVAFYNVAYTDGRCLAFPWILWDVLDHVRKNSSYRRGFFELGVYDRADPKLYPLSDNLLSYLHNPGNMIQKVAIYEEIFGFLHHLKNHTGMVVSRQEFDELVLGFKNYVDGVLGSCPDCFSLEQRLNMVTTFIKMTAFSRTGECPDVQQVCKNLYLKMAFQANPQIFKYDHVITSIRKLQKFCVKVFSELTQSMIELLEDQTDCLITCRLSRTQAVRENVECKVYQLLAHGTTQDMRKLREFLTIFIVEPKTIPLEQLKVSQVALLTARFEALASDVKGNQRYDSVLFVGGKGSGTGESSVILRARG